MVSGHKILLHFALRIAISFESLISSWSRAIQFGSFTTVGMFVVGCLPDLDYIQVEDSSSLALYMYICTYCITAYSTRVSSST